MKLDVTKIFPSSQIEALLLDKVNESDGGIGVGEISDILVESDAIVPLMEEWVKRIEAVKDELRRLEGVTKHPVQESVYSMLQHERGLTFEEYKELFYINTQDNTNWTKYQGFRLFNIISERLRLQFINKYTPDAEGYVQALMKANLSVMSFFLGGRLKAYLPLPKLKMHSYIVAPTGSGKSELIRAIFYELQKKYEKFSFVLIDPHGDLAKKVKRFHLNVDKERVIYIDPFLKDGYSPTFNVFDVGEKSIKNLSHTAEQIIISFEEVLSREGGELSESMVNMLEKSIYFLLERDGSTLVDLADLLNAQPDILQEAIEYSEYFNERFLKTEKRSRDALLYRVERLLNSPALKPLVAGQSTFSLEKSLNSGKVIIFNLGELGEMTQAAFGKFLVANIKSLVRKRDPEKSLPTFVFIDECQNLVSGSFEYILSQLRKYGLHLILANQYVNQLGEQVEAVKKNTAIKIVGGDEADDIKAMITLPKDQISLKDYEYYLKIRGRTPLKIKSPSFLINNPDFEMTSQEEQVFDKYQLSKYYKVVGQTKTERIPRKEGDPASPPPSKSTNKPPFDLFLGDDGDSTDK
ncbi:MAG: DUF87 domain-containing protein [Saprospiraceae bacterium]|nr:DUF87 domain-containing protein [Saprospiraceae bacterium]